MANKTIAFLLLPNIHLLDLAGPEQVFLEAIDYGTPLNIQYVSTHEAIQSFTKIALHQLKHFSTLELHSGDILMIPGADVNYLLSKEIKQNKALLEWLINLHSNGVILASICTGSFLLAHTGLLNSYKCTTHWKRTKQLQQLFPKLQVLENVLFVEENTIYTSAGLTAGIDLALAILAKIKDEHTAFKVARELVVYIRRQGNEVQQSIYLKYRNHIHAAVHAVQDFLIDNLHQKNNLESLAEIANMSARNLTRIFRKETNISINQYVTELRLVRMKELLKNPDLSRVQIAAACGLDSQRQLNRLLKLK